MSDEILKQTLSKQMKVIFNGDLMATEFRLASPRYVDRLTFIALSSHCMIEIQHCRIMRSNNSYKLKRLEIIGAIFFSNSWKNSK